MFEATYVSLPIANLEIEIALSIMFRRRRLRSRAGCCRILLPDRLNWLNHRQRGYQEPGSNTQERIHAANVMPIVVSHNGHFRVLRYATFCGEDETRSHHFPTSYFARRSQRDSDVQAVVRVVSPGNHYRSNPSGAAHSVHQNPG